ncbi:amidohydrolase [Alkalicella caledoniensis]|uniref:Amidohydrolase n=1 Tax=Alkalicella caledoniensis TaxID=2731377 RepID=A0A7G9W7Q0_ALKCA|nr:amidohydrolase [Alkalicella caledoniensis]QNO14712.1 amidohydrolase [Alkalicella caledoniensis]
MDVKALVSNLKEELINLRRDFHKYPELGFQEFRTQRVVEEYLKQCGLEVEKMAKTGVVGLLKGDNPGPTLLLRGDMDALPMTEEADVPYKSLNEGVMHSCAHDGHVAMLLVAAKILSSNKDMLHGNVKFVFQPNEEDAGAKFMVEEGVLQNPTVDACAAIHLWTPIEVGKISVSEGAVMGAHENFKVKIKGKGGHSSSPHNAIDPVLIASQVIVATQAITTKEINALKPTVINFSMIHGGTAPNIIPEEVELQGTLRYLYEGGPDTPEKPRKRMERIIAGICETFGASYEMEFIPCNFPVVNDAKMAGFVKGIAASIVGQENIVPYVTMAGEDFSEFTIGIPSTLYFVGAGNEAKDAHYPHHHPKFNIDEDSLSIGVEMHVRTALEYLSPKK